jgi:MoaE-MoaD fusion protein
MSITVKVLFFASAREAAGRAKLDLELGPTDSSLPVRASDALRELMALYPGLDFEGTQISVAVNQDYLGDEDVVLKPGDELALLPPIAGG